MPAVNPIRVFPVVSLFTSDTWNSPAASPIAIVPSPIVSAFNAFAPIPTLYLPLVTFVKAECPNALFALPIVTSVNAVTPTAVLLIAVVVVPVPIAK